MKLLIITQKMDKTDPVLGFFHTWVLKLSEKFENIKVICLERELVDLPSNIKVFSLGKESGRNKFKYVFNFYKYIWQLRSEYDAVFVHMNQEYILLGGIFWSVLGKKIYFWRNHPKGSFLTRIAIWFSEKVFYTSPQSFTATFKKGILMPVGIDTDMFKTSNTKTQIPNSILSLGRISPIKNIHKLVDAAIILDKKNIDFTLDIVGSPTNPEDTNYLDMLKKIAETLMLKGRVKFLEAVSQERAVGLYQNHQIFVNLTPSGSMDKTILEAIACGSIPLVVNEYYKRVEGVTVVSVSEEEIAQNLEFILRIDSDKKENLKKKLSNYVKSNHGLSKLVEVLSTNIQTK